MKNLLLICVFALFSVPLLNASTTNSTDCRDFAQESADAEWGDTVNSEAEYYFAYAEWFDMCDSMN